jgi:alpha-1,3/alpha-1,6-mannosyltransferase
MSPNVLFLPSFTENQRSYLLSQALCLIYTPSGEHFGIVPVEAMYTKLPPIAVNCGGPVETIIDGETGFLRDADADSFAGAMANLIKNPSLKGKLGTEGRKRVIDNFTLHAFVNQLEKHLEDILKSTNPDALIISTFFSTICIGTFLMGISLIL